jgi:peptidoglycan/LPS O-acetylase OafA/YrhL
MSIRRRQQAAMWTLAVLASLVLTAAGMAMTFSLIHTPESFAREGPGHALIFAGTVLSAAAAAWTRQSDLGWPVTLAVAGPALLVGWPDLVMPDSLMPHLGSLVALPAALAGLTFGLAAGRPPKGTQVQNLTLGRGAWDPSRSASQH